MSIFAEFLKKTTSMLSQSSISTIEAKIKWMKKLKYMYEGQGHKIPIFKIVKKRGVSDN